MLIFLTFIRVSDAIHLLLLHSLFYFRAVGEGVAGGGGDRPPCFSNFSPIFPEICTKNVENWAF